MATEDTTHIPSQQQSIQITDNLLEELNVFQTQKISNSTFQTKAGLKMWQNFVWLDFFRKRYFCLNFAKRTNFLAKIPKRKLIVTNQEKSLKLQDLKFWYQQVKTWKGYFDFGFKEFDFQMDKLPSFSTYFGAPGVGPSYSCRRRDTLWCLHGDVFPSRDSNLGSLVLMIIDLLWQISTGRHIKYGKL